MLRPCRRPCMQMPIYAVYVLLILDIHICFFTIIVLFDCLLYILVGHTYRQIVSKPLRHPTVDLILHINYITLIIVI